MEEKRLEDILFDIPAGKKIDPMKPDEIHPDDIINIPEKEENNEAE